MGSISQEPIRWKAEDDVLLKNALEAGASLEALAKGAVQFSRRFTLKELSDRWLSLLYDPNVAEQAARDMFMLEYYGANPSSKSGRVENNCDGSKVPKKRKAESIRRKYYAMRKKFQSEFFSNNDLVLLEPNSQEFGGHAPDFQNQVIDDGDPLGANLMLGDDLELREEDIDILRHAFPDTVSVCDFNENANSRLAEGGNCILDVHIQNKESSVSVKNCSVNEISHEDESINLFSSVNPDKFSSYETTMHASYGFSAQNCSLPNEPVGLSVEAAAPVATEINPNDDKGNEICSTGEFADPDSLLNLSNEGTILLEVVDEKDAEIKFSVEESNKDNQQNDAAKIEVENVMLEDSSSVPSNVNAVMSEAFVSSIHEGEPSNLQPEIDVPSKPTLNYNSAELGEDKMICVLNEQDTEVPCNDDIFLLIHPSPSSPFSTQLSTSVSMGACENDFEPKFFGWRHKLGVHGMQESVSAHPAFGGATKIEMHVSISQAQHTEFSKGRLLHSNSKLSTDSMIEEEEIKIRDNSATLKEIRQSMEAGSSKLSESARDSSASEHDDSLADDDVPYFSDIEAMILEMDLDECDQDLSITNQVPSFKYDETKRAIIRLEQSARSCLERAMTSKGALAVLYGRQLKYYFRKPEVLLGRSTDEIDVDIDLSKEGRANKISRRQAIIKMEADGSFLLKNLGKGLVYVNGMEVYTKQTVNLSSSCLIEIKGMSFIFEINQRYVRKLLSEK